MDNKKRKLNDGFTLIEAAVYTGILIMVSVTLASVSIQLIQSRGSARANRETYQEARYVLERIISKIRSSPGIDSGSSVFDSPSGTLVLKAQDALSNLTRIYLQNGIIYEQAGMASPTPLTSPSVIAHELRFRKLTASDVQSTIGVDIGLHYDSKGRTDLSATSTLNAQAALRNHFPFTWTQTDWSGGSGQSSWSDPTRYLSDNGRLDPLSCNGDVQLGNNPAEIVLHVGKACRVFGNFRKTADATAAAGTRVEDMPDQGLRTGGHFGNSADSAPADYVDMSFIAATNTRYRVWGRYKVINMADPGTSDSMFVQYNDSLTDDANPALRVPVNRIGTSQGLAQSAGGGGTWAWNDLWSGITNYGRYMYFANPGLHTIRIQRREDGQSIDQFTISASTYMGGGPASGTILPLQYATSAELMSSAFDTSTSSVFGQLFWSVFTPTQTTVRLQIRTAADEAGLAFVPWSGSGGAGTFYTSSGTGINTSHDGDRWIQYRVYLDTTNTQVSPVVNAVWITYSHE